MKREVDSTLVEKGVAERVRLADTYSKRSEELQRQHDHVKAALAEHKAKVRSL
jgi:phosphatidylinositol phospholipase C, beta